MFELDLTTAGFQARAAQARRRGGARRARWRRQQRLQYARQSADQAASDHSPQSQTRGACAARPGDRRQGRTRHASRRSRASRPVTTIRMTARSARRRRRRDDDLSPVSESRAGRNEAARRRDRAGVRRHNALGSKDPARRARRARERAIARPAGRTSARHDGGAPRGRSDGTVRARLLPDVTDESGTRASRARAVRPDLEPMVLYVDPETCLIAKQTYVAGGPGQPLDRRAVFATTRPVDGVQIAVLGNGATRRPSRTRPRSSRHRDQRPDGSEALFARPAS